MAKPARETEPEDDGADKDEKDEEETPSESKQRKEVRKLVREEMGSALKDFFGEIEAGDDDPKQTPPKGAGRSKGFLQVFLGEDA